MCRLFGFRSNLPAKVHRSLVTEKNSLLQQSREHKDGWGIAYYAAGETPGAAPEVAHGIGPAHQDPEFDRVSGMLSSHTVLAHVRLASVGAVHLNNAHPFIYRQWAFAHNGTVVDFALHRQEIESKIDPRFLSLVRGETDSERCFYLFLTRLGALQGAAGEASLEQMAQALVETTELVSAIVDRPGAPKPASMNFLATDGVRMVASRRNRTLFYSEHKKRDQSGEPPPSGGRLSQLVIASEELSGEDHWHVVPEGAVVGVDQSLRFYLWPPPIAFQRPV